MSGRALHAAVLAALAIAAPARPAAAKDAEGVVQLTAIPAALRPDAAYLLLRTSRAKSGLFAIQHVLLRVPSPTETVAYLAARQAAYDAALPKLTRDAKGGAVPTIDELPFDHRGPANAFTVGPGKFVEDGGLRTLLLEVPPGRYVLYGVTLSRGLVTCNCLGTVGFDARAGVVTQLGDLYADKVHGDSPLPHLEDRLGEHMAQYGFVFGQALVPATAGSPRPAGLGALPVEPARLAVMGPFREPGASGINRLAPIPGVLGYVRGRPVDLRAGGSR